MSCNGIRKGRVRFYLKNVAVHGLEEEEDQEKPRRYYCDVGSLGAQTWPGSLTIGPRERESVFIPEAT